MKAIIIADNDLVIDNVKTVLKSYGYDTIIYRWLLKALDNLEEISPHLIVVSSADYPRHWKTLAQFSSSGISGFFPQVILFTNGEISEEENEKAKALGVRGCFSSVNADGLDELRKILERDDDIFSGNPVSDGEDVFVPGESKSQANKVSDDILETVTESESSFSEAEFEDFGVSDDNVMTVDDVVEKNSVEEEIDVPTVDGIFENNGMTIDDVDTAPVEKILNTETESEVEVESVAESELEEKFDFETSANENVSEITVPEENVSDAGLGVENGLEDDIAAENVTENESMETKDDYDDPFGPIDYDTVFDDDDFSDGHEYISFMFTNPNNGILVTGTVSSLNGSTLEFLPDFGDFTDGLSLGNEISDCVMKRGSNVIDVTAQITDKTADGFTFFIKEK